ncbi:similar to Saccharomyces cerevisiae YIL019W FAF1 Protein required for pre-rRNA processing and 40S ribosomal subunit assembly [Maudiozyma saulgeensis]|uniref:Similar to Saccharomyces cerevisiae YIL019W FAF1 Protein required for pre-rRNA processing and 40S ribosomal subunit assembly n=1 Tax=Maudiozyma saulgeensis TaxID=1789683 RepID=A0A1X7R2P6_9SACH|nr:similar to Saccharomyces cerevisiae YIL019W FAF1 Protein required for pre-rRNA processing and 40S ribosomal subunit assembly [Kazachstania saulgeensis]
MGKTEDDEYMKQLEEQRKAFEAQFGSLESMGFDDKVKEGVENAESSISEEDESEEEIETGSSEESDEEDEEVNTAIPIFEEKSSSKGPRVIKFNGPSDTYIEPSKQEQKMIRSGKTLRQLNIAEQRKQLLEEQKRQNSKSDEEEEEQNLENDIELQRFLKESHLLSAFNQSGGDGNNDGSSGVDLTLKSMNDTNVVYQDDQVSGKSRMRTLEMRLDQLSQTNGHSNKINKLEKVPMNIRRGMVKKHVKRIKQYEQDAADGGIILSKVKKGQFRKIEATYKKDIERRIGQSIKSQDKEKQTKRQRGLKIQSVGRSTRNGLIISKDDISRIGGTVNNHKRKWNSNKPHKGRR